MRTSITMHCHLYQTRRHSRAQGITNVIVHYVAEMFPATSRRNICWHKINDSITYHKRQRAICFVQIEVSRHCFRSNIYLNKVSDVADYEGLLWLVEMVRKEGTSTPKTMIFCPNINATARLYRWIRYRLEEDAFVGGTWKQDDILVDMYHSHNDNDTREIILKEFVKCTSTIRLLVTTVALGLGVQIPDVRYVVHWGLGDSVLQYWQEIGRAGRDGQPARSIAYTKPAAAHSTDSPLRLAFSQAGCIWKTLLGTFLGGAEDKPACCGCQCCAECRQHCACDANVE